MTSKCYNNRFLWMSELCFFIQINKHFRKWMIQMHNALIVKDFRHWSLSLVSILQLHLYNSTVTLRPHWLWQFTVVHWATVPPLNFKLILNVVMFLEVFNEVLVTISKLSCASMFLIVSRRCSMRKIHHRTILNQTHQPALARLVMFRLI